MGKASKSRNRKKSNPTGMPSMKDTKAVVEEAMADAPEMGVLEARKSLQKQFPALSKVSECV